MSVVIGVWIAGYVLHKTITYAASAAASAAWNAVSSLKQGQEAYEERKRKLALAEAATTAKKHADELVALRDQVRQLQETIERYETFSNL